VATVLTNPFAQFQHPLYTAQAGEWLLWRDAYNGGWLFRDRYLKMFSSREDQADFDNRRLLTPVATHAASAVNEIRDSIFQRLIDVVRRGGSQAYQEAVAGGSLGVDMRGSTMNAFVGRNMLPDLVVMGRCGVYVDMPYLDENVSMADAAGKRPYLYSYGVEDIISWAYSRPDQPSEFKALMLRDTDMSYDAVTMLPVAQVYRFRRVWIDDNTGLVNMQFLDSDGKPCGRDGTPGVGPIELKINRIPFVMPDIGDSLMRNIVGHQVALLNIGSTDVNYALKANFPFYTEQKSGLPNHVRQGLEGDNTGTKGGQGAGNRESPVGITQGRYYGANMERLHRAADRTAEGFAATARQARSRHSQAGASGRTGDGHPRVGRVEVDGQSGLGSRPQLHRPPTRKRRTPHCGFLVGIRASQPDEAVDRDRHVPQAVRAEVGHGSDRRIDKAVDSLEQAHK
jgi:hypothetical protein